MRALVPEDLHRNAAAARDDGLRTLSRAAFAFARHVFDPSTSAVDIARRTFAGDRATELLVRAASSPAMTTTAGWADTFARVENVFLASLVGPSAGADVLGRGLQLRFDGAGSIALPMIAQGQANFVGQGKAIPVVSFTTTAGARLAPNKLALIATLTREMVESSNAEAIVRATLTESAARGLDAALFSANAGTADNPPGLLVGISALPASTASVLSDALMLDLSALAGSVARVAGDNIVFTMAPEQAVAANLMTERMPYPILASSALPAKTVIAVAANAIVSGFDLVPTIEASRETELVMDTVPGDVGALSSTMTMFQGDKIALKMRMEAAWTLRAQNAIAFMQNVAW
jgi:hypothetical protein